MNLLSMKDTHFPRIVLQLVLAIALATAGPAAIAFAEPADLSIDDSLQTGDRFQVTEGSGFEVINRLNRRIANVRVLARASGKKLLSVQALSPGQSLNFAFSRAGVYALCYAPGLEQDGVTCLEINVVKRVPA